MYSWDPIFQSKYSWENEQVYLVYPWYGIPFKYKTNDG